MLFWSRTKIITVAIIVTIGCDGPLSARAESLLAALARTYRDSPSLNAQRASVRAVDENVPQTLAGYRPRVSLTATAGQQSLSTTSKLPTPPGVPAAYFTQSGYETSVSAGLTVTQTLFDGFQTANRTRQAEAQVLAARATLAVAEQTSLLNAVTAYMNVLRDAAIRELQKSNVQVLQEQLRQTRDRFNVGEVTRTDVAQAESQLALGRSQLLTAESNYNASEAKYRQVIGIPPERLSPAAPVDRLTMDKLSENVAAAVSANPGVAAAEFNIDIAQLNVKVAEGALLPNLALQGSVQNSKSGLSNLSTTETSNASVLAGLSIPVYQGGSEYSLIRQAKESLSQRRLDLRSVRDQVRQSTIQAWGMLEGAKGSIEATRNRVQAAQTALNGVREEARVGQRTTLDILNALQELVNARVALVTAERDRVVASYTLLAAIGRLNPAVLGLRVRQYQPQVHYMQVRNAWAGTGIPTGK